MSQQFNQAPGFTYQPAPATPQPEEPVSYCQECGSELAKGAFVCAQCGNFNYQNQEPKHSVSDTIPESPISNPAPVQGYQPTFVSQAQPSPQQPQPVYGEAPYSAQQIPEAAEVSQNAAPAYIDKPTRPKSKISAALFAYIFGMFGAHQFYLGHKGSGIIRLLITILTFGLGALPMMIIAMIEGILYIGMKDDDFKAMYVDGGKSWF